MQRLIINSKNFGGKLFNSLIPLNTMSNISTRRLINKQDMFYQPARTMKTYTNLMNLTNQSNSHHNSYERQSKNIKNLSGIMIFSMALGGNLAFNLQKKRARAEVGNEEAFVGLLVSTQVYLNDFEKYITENYSVFDFEEYLHIGKEIIEELKNFQKENPEYDSPEYDFIINNEITKFKSSIYYFIKRNPSEKTSMYNKLANKYFGSVE